MARTYPPSWRVLAAFLVVPGAAAMGLAIVMPAYGGLDSAWERFSLSAKAFAIYGAYPSTVILGIPAYLFFRERLNPTFINCAFVGAMVATFPWLFLSLFSHMDYASVGNKATVINGKTTAYGFLFAFEFFGQIALFGALSGILFRLISAAGVKKSEI